ncbi:transglycosylase SLT domain-containing protein [Gluconobacter thailandicus]|uniref:Lytic transglycosylase domain-containing protein n=1 Tax=Gluconobacter thailandicus TaxID=257438 RepID=A0AAP9ET87_GLUTH|nr:transglycosylase SLT domain-containing protein [Gluconobacter thailandicus]QEH97359.1 lytic transglycosylase domain-containing protein [Gluconobacter thailandicus]
MTGKYLFLLFCIVLGFPDFGYANDWDATGSVCHEAVAVAEREAGIPSGLLGAISHVESGRRDPLSGHVVAWPWTVNAAGRGYFYGSKAEALSAVEDFRRAGIVSIDVGCMQINLHHHADAFSSLEEAFDPLSNARYGALFLRNLFGQLHGWPAATAAYHSLTPALGAEYEQHVMAVWNGRPDTYRPPDFLPQIVMTGAGPQIVMPEPAWHPSSQGQYASSRPTPTPQSGNAGRVVYGPPPRVIRHATNSGSNASGAGRGRDLMSYRSMPVRLAWRQN